MVEGSRCEVLGAGRTYRLDSARNRRTIRAMAGQQRKRILILGGGFGGVYTAMHLRKLLKGRVDIEVALVDQKNYFVFQPLLAEVISGSIDMLHTVAPIRSLCPGVRLYVRQIERIDLDKKVVVTSDGFRSQTDEIPYDHLVIALGTLENFAAVRGLPEHGFHFKNLGDALVLRNHLIRLLETADTEPDAERRRQLLTVVMAGGGFSGVEAITQVNDFARTVAHRFPRLDAGELRIMLLHSGTRILPELPESLSRYAQRLLDRRQVEIHLRTRLEAITADEAILNDGTRIPTKSVIATIGAAPNPVLAELPCQKSQGRLVVNDFLELPDYPGVWALGDCAFITDHKSGQPCPPTAQYAVSEAKSLATNILAAMDGTTQSPFSFSSLGLMGSLGHRSAVGEVLGCKISGILAWFLWRTVYWSKFPGLRRKLHVAIDWSLDLVLPKDYVQLDATPSESVSREHFEAGEVVFRQGDTGDRVYIIIDGEVEVVREQAHGDETVLARLEAEECFGEMALITDAPRLATVRAVTNMNALTLRRSAFATMFKHIPALRESFERLVQERNRRLALEDTSDT